MKSLLRYTVFIYQQHRKYNLNVSENLKGEVGPTPNDGNVSIG